MTDKKSNRRTLQFYESSFRNFSSSFDRRFDRLSAPRVARPGSASHGSVEPTPAQSIRTTIPRAVLNMLGNWNNRARLCTTVARCSLRSRIYPSGGQAAVLDLRCAPCTSTVQGRDGRTVSGRTKELTARRSQKCIAVQTCRHVRQRRRTMSFRNSNRTMTKIMRKDREQDFRRRGGRRGNGCLSRADKGNHNLSRGAANRTSASLHAAASCSIDVSMRK